MTQAEEQVLQNLEDEILERRRDGQACIDELVAQLDQMRCEAAMWRQRQESMARLAGWLLASVCLMVVVAILGWTR